MDIDLKKHHHTGKNATQFGQAGVLEKIFEIIGTTDKFFVEFGSEGTATGQGNSYYLRRFGFDGLLMDAGAHVGKAIFDVKTEFINSKNIISLFIKYNVPKTFDFLSIDIDNNDWYVFKSILDWKLFRPRVISVEASAHFPTNSDIIMPELDYVKLPCRQHMVDGCKSEPALGCSIIPLVKLANLHKYSYVAHCGVDAIFIDNNILAQLPDIHWVDINDINKIHPGPIFFPFIPDKSFSSVELI